MSKSPSASPDFSVREFFQRFATEDDCLEHIMQVRFGGTRFDCMSCGTVGATHHKLQKRRTYVAACCGHHVNPTAGTVLENTRTPLVSWFYAMYLFCTTRHGVSGKELQRQLGVTYKTAYRIGQQIRDLMTKANGYELLTGHVEIDETYMGGRARGELGRPSAKSLKKTPVVAIISREGRMAAEVTIDAKTPTLRALVHKHVEQGATVSTDKYRAYTLLAKEGFNHGAVNHGLGEYARTEADGTTFHVNSVEGFWRLFKSSVRSTHIAISRKHMQRYLDEFTFRANHRNRVNAMFDLLVGAL